MALQPKALLVACAAPLFAVGMTACGSSTKTSDVASSASSVVSSASSAASSVVSSASSAISSAAAPEGSLASQCTDIDSIMMGNPDADPAGTAAKLEEIKTKISTPDADLVGNVAAAYTEIAANPNDPAAQEKLKSSASALGAGCESATTTAKPN